jgi:hypothetical protein
VRSINLKGLAPVLAVALVLGSATAACGDDSASGSNNNNVLTNDNGNVNDNENLNNNNTPGDICLLNMCEEDSHCEACSEGRNTCLVEENRCVSCNPTTGEGCPAGQECSSFGICVDIGLTCPTDTDGNPEVVCVENADCFACSPMHQVCNTTTHLCVACTATNTSHCLPTDICLDDLCSPPCPSACEADSDCDDCEGAPGCFQHKCSECSDTYPCAAGLQCENGSCIHPCGLIGPTPGTCGEDADCEYCGDTTAGTDPWECDIPIASTYGVCVPPAAGCADLGGLTLPAPWNQYSQTCDNDAGCANADIDYNLGPILRDTLGDTIDVFGLATISIGDAIVSYGMNSCATFSINGIDCGVCVPCKEDVDCEPIPITPLLDDILVGDGLSEFVIDLAIGIIFGDEPPQLNFYCQPVAAGYGVCAPCSNPFQACGNTSGGGGSGTCDHPVCEEGTPLDPSCGDCAAAVCAADSFCCNDTWDAICVGQVDTECAVPCGGGASCSPDICTDDSLPAQNAQCSDCVDIICANDPYCCNTTSGAWDDVCVAATLDSAYATECNPICAGGCAHDECVAGPPLDIACSTCAGAICTADSFCCDTDWDSLCVEAAEDDDVNCTCP